MAKPSVTWKELRAFALTLPETNEEFPWGDPVVKVRKKIFIFLGQGTAPDLKIGLKLHESSHAALGVPGAVPTGYGLGKAGWVTIPIGGAYRRRTSLSNGSPKATASSHRKSSSRAWTPSRNNYALRLDDMSLGRGLSRLKQALTTTVTRRDPYTLPERVAALTSGCLPPP